MSDSRRYQIQNVLGEGGFGRVYRATLDGPEGFRKAVAVKLLRRDDVDTSVLQRFRDEARILGLVRDRACISVDPPIRLGGRWAVVMEYVEGYSLSQVLPRMVVPPTAALEIVQEIARALDRLYRHQGPDGQPLLLLHRDIKPANIQITTSGEVKILDWGTARAFFSARESKTTNTIVGTIGYVAPERHEGKEGPEGDVFSLGVLLEVLVTGDKPIAPHLFQPRTGSVTRTPDIQKVVELARQMQAISPEQRPTTREVEDRVIALRNTLSGPTLRNWVEHLVIPPSDQNYEDELVGSTLTETDVSIRVSRKPTDSGPSVDPTEVLVRPDPGLGRRVFLLSGLIVALALTSFLMLQRRIASRTEAPAAATAELAPAEVPPVAEAPVAEEPEAGKEIPTKQKAETRVETPKKAPVEVPKDGTPVEVPTAVEKPPEITVKPQPVEVPPVIAEVRRVSFTSKPLGADLRVDGKSLGSTPRLDVELPYGVHQVEMILGEDRIQRQIEVGRHTPARWRWTGGEGWQSLD